MEGVWRGSYTENPMSAKVMTLDLLASLTDELGTTNPDIWISKALCEQVLAELTRNAENR